MKQGAVFALSGTVLAVLVVSSINSHLRDTSAGQDSNVGVGASSTPATRKEEKRGLLFWGGSKKSQYDGQRGNEFCYNVNVGDGTLCCDSSYNVNTGFKKGAVCYLENDFSCKDLHQAVFVPDGEITMDSGMIGKRAFPSIVTGSGFMINDDPSAGMDTTPYDYNIATGSQNGLSTQVTGNGINLPSKSFLVSGWDESQESSDHEIEWAGPSTVGLGGESFMAPAVIMKGGKGAMVYLDDDDGVLHGAGIRTPIDPEKGVNAKTEHVEFCFDYTPGDVDGGSLFRDNDKGNKGNDNGKGPDKGEDTEPGNSDKVIVCHGTASDTNPYVLIEVDDSALAGHFQQNHAKGNKRADVLPGDDVEIDGKKGKVNDDCSVTLDDGTDLGPSEDPDDLPDAPTATAPTGGGGGDAPTAPAPTGGGGDAPTASAPTGGGDAPTAPAEAPTSGGDAPTAEAPTGGGDAPTAPAPTGGGDAPTADAPTGDGDAPTAPAPTGGGDDSKEPVPTAGGDAPTATEPTAPAPTADDNPAPTAPEPEPTAPAPTNGEEPAPAPTSEEKPEPAPTSEEKPAPAPTPAGIKGDPHIKKWDGSQYDFHGGCDLVMLHNPDFNNGQGLYIHVRTKIEHWWSYIESAVVKIGDDTLEVKGGVEDRRYWVNGKEGRRFRASRNLPFTIGGYHGRFRAISKILTQFKLYLPNGQNVAIKSAKNMLRVDMENCNEDDFGNSLGLMGTFGKGLMLARDNRTVIEDPNKFGMEWQVLNTEEQLFHEVVGPQHPQKCAMPTTQTFLRHQGQEREARRMLVETISRGSAEAACKGAVKDEFEDCVYDVMATNDADMASGYV